MNKLNLFTQNTYNDIKKKQTMKLAGHNNKLRDKKIKSKPNINK